MCHSQFLFFLKTAHLNNVYSQGLGLAAAIAYIKVDFSYFAKRIRILGLGGNALEDLRHLRGAEKKGRRPLTMEELPPSIPRWFGKVRPSLNLVEVANNLDENDTIVAYCLRLMGQRGIASRLRKKVELAVADPDGEESRVRDRTKVLSQECVYRVPGKPIKLRIKCRECSWESDDDLPAWDTSTDRYVARLKNCETPDCTPKIPAWKGRRKQRYFVPTDVTVPFILERNIYKHIYKRR